MEEQNEDDLNVDMTEIKKILEDANMFEPNMTRELMISYYRALRNSEITASEEDQTRRLNESHEEPERLLKKNVENMETTPVQNKEKKLSTEGDLERNNNENTIQDATKVTFGFNEMAEDSGHTLNIITHELKYVAIQNSNKFLNAEISLKAKMLYAYHTKVNKMKAELARLSFFPAPLPKIITVTETFPTFSDKDTSETYACCSERQTKRKIYEDDDDSLDGISNKKVKNPEEDEWLKKPAQNKNSRIQKKQETNKVNSEIQETSKEEKTFMRKETGTPVSKNTFNTEIVACSSIFKDTPKCTSEIILQKLKETEEKKESYEKNMELFPQTLEKLDDEADDTIHSEEIFNEELTDETSKEKKTFMRKETGTPVSKNTSNTEIVACSSIFKDTPKCTSEIMLQKLKETEEKKESYEKNMELFPQTLEKLDEEADGTIPSEEINEELIEGLAPLDIKISTPIPKEEGTAEQDGPSQGKEEQVSRTYLETRPPIRSELDTADSSPSTSGTSNATIVTKNIICPICDGSFEESKIEEHAATCGDDPFSRSSSKIARITCAICDKVVDFDTSYEVHKNECISRKRDKDQ